MPTLQPGRFPKPAVPLYNPPMPHQDDKTRLISLPEAAELYGFSPDYLRNLAQKGRLKAQKVAGAWITTPAHVEDYIQSRKKMGAFREDIQLN